MNFNHLVINSLKSFLAFHPNKIVQLESQLIKVNNIYMKQTDPCQLLGLNIDCLLTWKDHVEYVAKKNAQNYVMLCLD